MPSTNSRQLTLTTVGLNTTINVSYNAVFSVLERHLAGLGLRYRERIDVWGVDPPPDPDDPIPGASFPVVDYPVTDGNVPQTIARNVSRTVLRSILQEDAGLGDNDEIRCRIRIERIGFPPGITPDAFTDTEVLVG